MGHKPRASSLRTPAFAHVEVAGVFESYPANVRDDLLVLRQLIFDVARKTEGVGEIVETLKWNQPAYLTPYTKSGTTIRLGPASRANSYALYVHCQSSVVDETKQLCGDRLRYEKTRAIVFTHGARLPEPETRQCIELALTYHLRKT